MLRWAVCGVFLVGLCIVGSLIHAVKGEDIL